MTFYFYTDAVDIPIIITSVSFLVLIIFVCGLTIFSLIWIFIKRHKSKYLRDLFIIVAHENISLLGYT